MAIPVTNIPVLTGEVAERFIKQCEYNARYATRRDLSIIPPFCMLNLALTSR